MRWVSVRRRFLLKNKITTFTIKEIKYKVNNPFDQNDTFYFTNIYL